MLSLLPLIAAALALMLLSSAPAEARTPFFGFNEDWTHYGKRKLDRAVKKSRKAGADINRIPVSWAALEPAEGLRNWAALDAAYAAMRKAGQRPLFVVFNSPCWARQNPYLEAVACNGPAPPDPYHDDRWAALFYDLAARYPRASAIQVWNEPNLPIFWGSDGGDPERYVELLRLASAAIDAVQPGLATLIGSPSPAREWRSYLREILGYGAKSYSDGIGLQTYPSKRALKRGPDSTLRSVEKQIKHTKKQIGRELDLWVTEVGFSTDKSARKRGKAFSAKRQSRMLRDAYRMIKKRGAVGIIVHRLVDIESQYPWQRGLGVMRTLKDPKPAYCKLAKIRGKRRAC